MTPGPWGQPDYPRFWITRWPRPGGLGLNDRQNSTAISGGLSQIDDFSDYAVICFAAGARVVTRSGARTEEQLHMADTVWTRDNGVQPLRWTDI